MGSTRPLLVPPRRIKAIRMIHDDMRARVQLDGGHFSVGFNICQGLRQRWVLSPRLSFASAPLQQVSEDIVPNRSTNGTSGCRSRSGYSKRRQWKLYCKDVPRGLCPLKTLVAYLLPTTSYFCASSTFGARIALGINLYRREKLSKKTDVERIKTIIRKHQLGFTGAPI